MSSALTLSTTANSVSVTVDCSAVNSCASTAVASGLAFTVNLQTQPQVIAAVPEPGTLALFAIGLMGLAVAMRRRAAVRVRR